MAKNVTIYIDNVPLTVPDTYTIMQAADSIGIHIPRLCFHHSLSTFGACRICVVEVEGLKAFPPSCATAVVEGMKVQTMSAGVQKARKQVLELILASHNGDCTICEKNGACDLRALAEQMDITTVSIEGEKRHYTPDASSASLIRRSEKCILCGKCVRVCSEIQGVNALTFSHRGFKTNVVPAYNNNMADSVCINCGQCVNVCPTGALIEKDGRDDVWKNLHDPDKVVVVQIAPAVRVAIGEGFGLPPGKDMSLQTVTALKLMGFEAVFDTQFSADLTIMEEGHELIHRIQNNGTLPMVTSCSPGWIKFCETFYPQMLPHISTCKSPQQMMGALIKTYYAEQKGIDPKNLYSVSIMPCVAKKFEAARPEMNASGYQDVDVVLTTRELVKMIRSAGINLAKLPPTEFDNPLGASSGAAPIFGATGGVMEAALRTAYEVLTGNELPGINFTAARGFSGIREAEVAINGLTVRIAIAHGLANVHKVFSDIIEGRKQYHFIEIMTCPGGCLGGGGQPYPTDGEYLDKGVYDKRAEGLYAIDNAKGYRKSHQNPDVIALYQNFLEKPLGHRSHQLLHTHYHGRQPKGIPVIIQDSVTVIK
ncbi:MAG: iron hydrogenase small subunit [Chitinivibrionales bacterium]|nr:iron hydrogenase small subunit [Chitinivibrionales bacterium]